MSNVAKVFGIDLGTTYSAIAYVDEHGQPIVVKNTIEDNMSTMPSVVLVEPDGSVVVGSTAKKDAVSSPDRVFEEIKRSMGDPNYFREIDGVEYRPEFVSSLILKKIATYASEALGEPVRDVVITVPAYFNEPQREATRIAGEIAGLNVLSTLNEPTAAAFAYGQSLSQGQTTLVFDLGGGTFDVTIIEIGENERKVIVTGGDHNLGGRRWDEEIVKYVAHQFRTQTGIDPLDDTFATQDLWVRCEDAKKILTTRTSTKIPLVSGAHRVTIELTRDKFEEITAHLLQSSIALTRDMLEEAKGRGVSSFDAILLVGGSTKMPMVSGALKANFGMEPKLYDPDEAVAKGAAIVGLKLRTHEEVQVFLETTQGKKATEENVSEAVLEEAYTHVAEQLGLPAHAVRSVATTRFVNVLSHSVGVVYGLDNKVAKLIHAQTPLPAFATKSFGTLEDYQDSALIVVVQGEDEDASQGTQLNTGDNLLPIPPGLPKGSPIDVTFTLDEDGSLTVLVKEMTAGREIVFAVDRPGIMSKEEIERATQSLDLLNAL